MKPNSLIATDVEPFLETMEGENQGDIYSLGREKITLGRQEDNDIVLKSDSVSRHHAEIERQENGQYVVRDLGSKNGIVVNGHVAESHILALGDILQVGIFVFRFNGFPASQEPAVVSGGELARAPLGLLKSRKRLFIYGGVALLLVWLLSMQKSTSPEKEVASSKSLPESNWEGAINIEEPKFDEKGRAPTVAGLEDPTLTRAEQSLEERPWSNSGLREAEVYFRQGQKEYLNKNYHRAIENFQSSLTFYKDHQLARYYLRLSVFEAEKEAAENMDMGIRYFQSLQYSRAIYHFEQAKLLMNHKPTLMEADLAKKLIDDAERYREICSRQLKAAEIFP